jgi:light-independent protochlorophyllide reductase subunit B
MTASSPQALLVGASCTAELIQDDPGGLAQALDLPVPVVPLELPSYQSKENWGAAETFYQLVRALLAGARPRPQRAPRADGARPRCNLLGPTALGFRHRDDLHEISGLLASIGVDVHVVAPLDATPADIGTLGEARFQRRPLSGDRPCRRRNGCRRTLRPAACATHRADRRRRRPAISFAEVATLCRAWMPTPLLATHDARALPWYARSVDSTYLTGKRVFIFGDATHAVAAARVAPR